MRRLFHHFGCALALMIGLGGFSVGLAADEEKSQVQKLPEPNLAGKMLLEEAIAERRSVRGFTDRELTLQEIGQLCWAGQGITDPGGEFRASPSAGALYPDETYVFAHRVEGCGQGIYHYEVRHHRLAMLAEGSFGGELARACLGQDSCATAAAVLAWGAVIDRCALKYGDRAYRYIYLDAGHIGAHLQLACCTLGLGSVNVGAFYDDEVNALLGLDGQMETAIYLTAVGHPA